jgi:hypothetical protein
LQQKAGHRSGKCPGFSPDELRVAFSIPSGSLFLVNHLVCLSTLCDASPNKKSPLLELIYNQDRGNLNYPNERIIKLVEFLVQIIQEILPYLPHKKVDYILNKILISYLYINPIFRCKIQNYTVCSIIIVKLVSPVLSNYFNSKTQFFKKTNILTKERKLMKLN